MYPLPAGFPWQRKGHWLCKLKVYCCSSQDHSVCNSKLNSSSNTCYLKFVSINIHTNIHVTCVACLQKQLICPSGFYQPSEGSVDECLPCDINDELCRSSPGAFATSPTTESQLEMLEALGVLQPKNGSHTGHTNSASPSGAFIVKKNELLQEWGSTITLILVGFVASLLSTHRCWPMACRCSDFLFAGDHYVGDGHAKRMLDSRLGAAFTLSLPFVLGIFGVQIFGADNTLKTDGLVPGISLNPRLDALNSTLFNKLYIDLQTFALLPGVDCSTAIGFDATQAGDMICRVSSGDANITVEGIGMGTKCMLKATCDVSGNLALSSVLLVSLPEVFQKINYTVRADSWNGIDADTVVGDMFGPAQGKVLVGSKDSPSQVNFELTRSRYRDSRRVGLWGEQVASDVPYRYGLQLSKLKRLLVEDRGMDEQVHYLAFNFEASDNVYTVEYSDQQSFSSQISGMFTFLLSSLALFRFVKSYAELVIDNAYVYLSERRGVPLPEDVHHRTCVLEERLEDLGDRGVEGLGQGLQKRKKRASRRMSAFLSQEDDQLEKEVELVSIENPMGVKVNSASGKDVQDVSARVDLLEKQVALLLQSNQQLTESNQELSESNQKPSERVTLLESGHVGGNTTGKLEVQVEKFNVKVESGQLPSGWEEFKDDEGRSYYVGPEGQSSWEIPVNESVSTLSMHKSSIRRNSVVGKRRSSMRVAAASVAKKDMG